MPYKPLNICLYPGCSRKTAKSYCPEHTFTREKQKNIKRITGRAAQRRQAYVLNNNPLCVECEKKGVFKIAVHLDHIIPLAEGGEDVTSNLQPLCIECHKKKTIIENRKRNKMNRQGEGGNYEQTKANSFKSSSR